MCVCVRTYDGEAHDLEDPDGEGQVDQDQDHQQQDQQVEAALPPAVDPHLVHLGALQRVPMRTMFLAHLGTERHTWVRHTPGLERHTGVRDTPGLETHTWVRDTHLG